MNFARRQHCSILVVANSFARVCGKQKSYKNRRIVVSSLKLPDVTNLDPLSEPT